MLADFDDFASHYDVAFASGPYGAQS